MHFCNKISMCGKKITIEGAIHLLSHYIPLIIHFRLNNFVLYGKHTPNSPMCVVCVRGEGGSGGKQFDYTTIQLI